MATLSFRSLTLMASAGVGGLYFSNNMSSASNAVSNAIAHILPFAGMYESAPGAGSSTSIAEISEQVSALARDVSRNSNQPMVVLRTPSSRVSEVVDAMALAGWVTLAASLGGASYYLAVWKGWRMGDLAWVSRKSFTETVDAVQTGIARVRGAVSGVRREVAERLLIVEARIEAVRAALGDQIDSEVTEVKVRIADVGKEVQSVAEVLADVNGRIDCIDGKLDTATHGIMALVRVVSSLAPDAVRPESPFYSLKMLAADKRPPEAQEIETHRLSSGLSSILSIESFASPCTANGLANGTGKILHTSSPR